MNKAFKVIWNHATQTWVAASEVARAKGKTKSVKTAKTALAAAVTSVVIGGVAQAASSYSDGFTVGSYTGTRDTYPTVTPNSPVNDATGDKTGYGDYFVISAIARPNANGSPNSTGFVAVGAASIANMNQGTALGYGAKAYDIQTTAIGANATASGRTSISIGQNSIANGSSAISLGNNVVSSGLGSTSVGTLSSATANRATALGSWAGADGNFSTVLGVYSNSTESATNATTLGSYNKVEAVNSIAIGTQSSIQATAANSTTIGLNNTVSGEGTIALGNNITATAANNVILGQNSSEESVTTTKGTANQITSATVANVTYGGFAGTATGIVSVGAKGAERQIINVAPGEISATSTDAINGSQLYLVTKGTLDQFPVIYTDADGNKLIKAPDGNFYPADNVLIDGKYYPPGTTPEQVAAGTATPATPVDAGDVIASMNDGDNVADSPKTLANVKGNLTPTYNVGDMTIDATTGVPSDVASTEYTKSQTGPTAEEAAKMYNNAATVGDVLNAGWNLQGNDEAVDFVKPYDTVNFKNGEGTTAVVGSDGNVSTIQYNVNVDGKTTQITYVNAKGDQVTKVGDKFYNPSDVNADGTPKAGAVPVENVTSQISAIGPKVNGENVTGPISLIDGDTTTVTPTAGGIKVEVKTGDITNNPNGTVTGPVTPALTDALKAAEDALAALPADATEAQKKAAQNAVDAAQAAITNAGNAVATAQNVADMINASGWRTNSTTATVKAEETLVNPGDQVNFEAGKNMVVTQEINATTGVISYTYATKDDLVLNSTTIGGSYTNEAGDVITTSPITIMTTPEGKNVITNLTTTLPPTTSFNITKDAGEVVTAPNKAAPITAQEAQNIANTSGSNAATLGDVLNAGWNLKVNDEAVDFVKPYDTVAFVNGTGTTARIDYTNGTQSNVTFDINVDDKTITIGEDGKLTAITPAPVIITKEGPINLENTNTTRIEVNQTTGNVSVNVNTGTSKVDENGKAVPNTTVDAGRVATIGDITTTINNTGWNILNHAGERVDLVNPADNVQFKQGTGTQVTVTSEDGKTSIVTYSAKIDGTTIKADANGTLYADMPAPTIITKDGTLNFENTETATIVTNPTGNISVKVETGVASVSDGAAKDADGKTVPAGKAIADANNANKVATVGNIVDVINNSGFGLLANGTNASTVNPGDTVDLKNTDGNVVITKAADSNDVEFNLAKNITIGQSVTAPTVNVGGDAGNTALTTVAGGNYNSTGQKIDDTAVPALSVGGNQITNVANGAISPSSTDAINGSQLYAVQNNFNQQIGAVNNRIDDLDSNRKAGSASAMAAAGLPQAYREGQSGFVAAVGQYEGETGVAVGFTSISDNGKWLFRGSYATNSQNENAGNLGIGYFW